MSNQPTTVRIRPPFQNSSAFRATGKGWANQLPNFPATLQNANGVLTNKGLGKGDRNYQMPLFVTGVQTGFHVTGSYGQSAGARTYYPHNLSQDPLVINCIVANNFEYDRVVEFVKAHQQRAIASWTQDPNGGQGPATEAVEFALRPFVVGGVTIYGGLPGAGQVGAGNGALVQGYITSMPAGAERFQNARTFSLNLMVSHDYMDDPMNILSLYNKQLVKRYMKTFNQLFGRKPDGSLEPAPQQSDPNHDLSAPTDYWSRTAGLIGAGQFT